METFLRFLCLTFLGVFLQYGNIASADSNRSVGSPKGKFDVSSTGGAVYSVSIDAPKGLGKLQPNVSLTYNSQAGYGIVGYGTNVSGISVITRGCKDIYHDGYAKGSEGLGDGAYFLDGKRLIKQNNIEGIEGATYVLEGDPFTKVRFYGSYSGSSANVKIVVKTKDGLTCSYGSGSDSRLFYTQASRTSIQAWYIDKVEDVYGNTMTYSYIHVGNCIYPAKITYGRNSSLSTSSTSTITFTYQSILNKNTQCVTLGGRVSNVDRRLSAITTATGNEVYRRYMCEYDSTLDASKIRYSRLVKVTEYNGKGECLNPIVFGWKGFAGVDRKVSYPKIDVDYHDFGQTILNSGFISADFNGDGLSDIIKLASVKELESSSDGMGQHYETASVRTILYYYQAKRNSNATISYDYVGQQKVRGVADVNGITNHMGGAPALDFNGDGKADILVPITATDSHQNQSQQYILWFLLLDKSRVTGYSSHLLTTRELPLYASLDINKDGRSEVIYVEKAAKDGKYPGGCLNCKNNQGLINETLFSFVFPKTPKKIFSGDFNNDGMPDLLFTYDGGYKIYFNNGTDSFATAFTEQNSKTGTTFGDDILMEQGDFNGDGLVDFVHCDNNGNANFAFNNGDGTFTAKYAIRLDMKDKNTGKDDDKYEIIPFDMDGDGKTDLLALKSDYKYHGGFHNHYSFRNTQVAWLRSTGEKLVQEKVVFTNGETDAIGGNVIVGDFTGDGQMSIMGYGKNIYNANASDPIKMRLYATQNYSVSSGKINTVTDGLGNVTSIEYASLTDSTVCLPTITSAKFPVVDIRPDLVMVKRSLAHGLTTDYRYGGLKAHVQGLGLIGFERTQSKVSLNNETTESIVDEWNPKYYTPQKVTTCSSVGDWKASSTSTISFAELNGTYFSYPKEQVATDYDGNVTTTSCVYDVEKGCPLTETVTYGSDAMYKKTEYKNYVKRLETWLPTTIVSSQKHEDANEEYASTTMLSYDEKGQVVQKEDHAGTPLALSTTNVYDSWGNVISSKQEGYGMATITKHYDYDNTKRFLKKEWQTPAAAEMLYTYDTWGDVLSAIDMTDVTHPLTTRYQYDGWGNLIKTIHPTNAVETSSINWGSSTDMKYYIEESGTGKPTVKTWYDSYGRKTLCQYALPCGVQHKETYAYNAKDQVLRKSVSDGKLAYMELLSYDKLGRMTSDNQTQRGKNYSYAYGNRSVTTKIGGKSYTKTTDAWGNVKTSSDPVSSVSYVYNSMGKPVEIDCEGSKTLVEYDAVGNKTSMTDPDAGTTTYEYAADGKLLKQTDACGIVTTNTYDELGRLTTSHVGDMEITRTYGTSGNDNLQLIKTTCSNNSESYSYDVFGRLTSRTRSVEGDESHQYTYSYNMDGSIANVTYPGELPIDYVYDANGYLVAKKYKGLTVWSLASYDGLVTQCNLMNTFVKKTKTIGKDGHIKNICFNGGFGEASFEYEYDSATDNLLSRTGVNSQKETFTYDGVDRLTSVSCNGQRNLIIKYANDGNILNKLDVGNYEYGQKPHAVMSVDNTRRIIPSATLSTEFNELGKIGRIEDGNSLTSVDFIYGPDMQRWKSTTYNNGAVEKTTFYDTDYDKVIDKDGNTTEFIYVDDNVMMLRKNNGYSLPYIVTKDVLGSVVSIYGGDGKQVFSATYDAWGKQTVTMNKIGFIRGYCGHEMLNDYQIINMNGRLYDPVLGRFLSPDNYVQTPDFSQNYNRYSYCLNNPLKYTDPSGELFGIDDFLVFSVVSGAIMGAMHAGMSGKSIWKGALFGAAGGAATYGIGAAFGAVGGLGHELLRAGAHGLSTGLFNGLSGENFFSGVVSGAGGSLMGTFAQSVHLPSWALMSSTAAMGGAVSLASGGNFYQGLLNGLQIGAFNFAEHDITYRHDSQGHIIGSIRDVVIYPSEAAKQYIETAGVYETAATGASLLQGLNEYRSKCRIGTNGKYYFPRANNRQFYGNQYVKTELLKKIKYVNHFSRIFTSLEDYNEFNAALIADGNKIGRNCEKYMAEIIGREIGSRVGYEVGYFIGGYVGSGFASVPLSICGGIAVEYLGGEFGSLMGGLIYDALY